MFYRIFRHHPILIGVSRVTLKEEHWCHGIQRESERERESERKRDRVIERQRAKESEQKKESTKERERVCVKERERDREKEKERGYEPFFLLVIQTNRPKIYANNSNSIQYVYD